MRYVLTLGILVALNLQSAAQMMKHVVKKGETLYELSRLYQLPVDKIAAANKLTPKSQLRLGQTLLIPVQKMENIALSATHDDKPRVGMVHVVQPGETVYSIARSYGVSPDDVMQTNDMKEPNIRVGQSLIISIEKAQATRQNAQIPVNPDVREREEKRHTLPAQQVPTEVISTENAMASSSDEKPRISTSQTSDYPVIFEGYAQHYKMKKTRGFARQLSDYTTGNPYLALYSGAETGSIIRVTNLMNKKTIFLKVIGQTTPLDYAQETLIKVSKKAAEELEVSEEKFLVEVASYPTR
ncbi:MAG: LysM peptidoglycan-binding domain-containing protein [Chitinophagales bacterium]|nr:LysM peptidoglycan-binding domain-containing protein [Chitinophagales bacterium]MDW8417981.1 LysM peptidoglycan-binding domain-containing protein [Chitinophagales bacterium]